MRKTFPILPVLLVAFCRMLSAQSHLPQHLALVNGQPISSDEVETAAAERLRDLDLQKIRFDLEMKKDRESALENALERILTERVLAAEASKRNVSVQDLLEIEVDSKAAPATDERVVEFYNANKSWIEGSLGENVRSIRAYLGDQDRKARLDAFVDSLKRKYGAVSYVEPSRIEIPTHGRPSKGPADAPVTIVEFSDFECPYCRALLPTLQRIAADYQNKVRIVYLQFPLADIHPNALKAAEASLCALDQAKFWPMHDLMFSDQPHLGVDDLKHKASKLSLDMASFTKCLDSGRYFTQVRNDVSDGVKAGVTGTPALFINGRSLLGNQPYDEIRKVIEDELRRAARRQQELD